MLNMRLTQGVRSARQSGGCCARPLRRPHLVSHRAGSSNQPAESDPAPATSAGDELPPELQDLAINEDGFLIDTKTGKMINEMGATRFDVAVRALRGELDPPTWVENSERTPGVILSALYQFPRTYIFQVVGKPPGRQQQQAFVCDVTAAIGRVTQEQIEGSQVEVKERMGGKYVSVAVNVNVRAPELVSMVYDELAKDARVVMKF